MKKVLLTAGILILLLVSLAIYQKTKFEDGKTHIIFCNVGQGDGILINSPKGLHILVDAGPDNSILNCLSSHIPFWDRKISLMVLTHPHSDHMTGMVSVLSSYKVADFGTEELVNNTYIYNKLIQNLKDKNIKKQFLYAGDSFETSDGLAFKILGPSKEFLAKANPSGIVGESKESGSLSTLLSFGSFSVILTGDTPIEELKEGLDIFEIPDISVFQISHHGSSYNTDKDLVEKIMPKLAVISVGKNKYGHPSNEVIKILRDLDIKYLRTDQHGDIEIITDGKNLRVN